MCGGCTLTYNKLTEIEEFLRATDRGAILNSQIDACRNYNAAPTQEIPAALSDENG